MKTTYRVIKVHECDGMGGDYSQITVADRKQLRSFPKIFL